MHQELIRAKELAQDSPDECVAICNNILNDHYEDQTGQTALFMIGYVMLEAERFGLAYNIFKRCAELSPNRPEIYTNMGMCIADKSPP